MFSPACIVIGLGVLDAESVKDPVVSRPCESKLFTDDASRDSVIKEGFDGGSDSQTLFIMAASSRCD
jgi:hypothetical protein